MTQRKVCIITGSRAEWGLLSGIARALKARTDVCLQIVVTNMHLDPRYGLSVNEIEADGFHIDARVPLPQGDDEASVARAMGSCLSGMADAFHKLCPDIAVILGDRTEMLAVAAAALTMRIPIVHLHGGEITEGAVDDSIRHAITKMASLHLTSTDEYRHRVIQMGEDPELVLATGAIGVYNNMTEQIMPLHELEASLGHSLSPDTLLVTYHPVTLDPVAPEIRFGQLLEALDRFPELPVLFTYPNNDARGAVIIDLIERYRSSRPDTVFSIPSLGRRRYLSALHYVSAVIGNSSSGIIEVPTAGIPTVNIGIRQQGRLAADSVIHCGDSADEIASAIARALSPEFRLAARNTVNPYFRPDTLDLIVNAIADTPMERLRKKHFHDIAF